MPTRVCGASKDRSGVMPQQRLLNCLRLTNRGSDLLQDAMKRLKRTSEAFNVTFEAVVDGDRETRYGQPTEEVSAAPPMPDETVVGESGQPEEEVEDESLNAAILEGIRAQVGDVVNFLETGKVKLGDREHTFYVACGSSRHSLRGCNTEFAPILENLQPSAYVVGDSTISPSSPYQLRSSRRRKGGQCFSTTS